MKIKDFYCHIDSFLWWIAQHCVFYSTLTSLSLLFCIYFCISVTLLSENVQSKMAAMLPKRHLVAVTQKASEFLLLVINTLWFSSNPEKKPHLPVA